MVGTASEAASASLKAFPVMVEKIIGIVSIFKSFLFLLVIPNIETEQMLVETN